MGGSKDSKKRSKKEKLKIKALEQAVKVLVKNPDSKKNTVANQIFKQSSNLVRKASPKSRPLFLGELHMPLHNYSGPATRLDLESVRKQEPFNGIDNCSKTHDLDYKRIGKIKSVKKRNKERRKADLKLIKCYSKNKGDWGYIASNLAMKSKIKLEKNFPEIANRVLGKLSSVQTK